jgi:ubiquinone/menaquinone biosynthesis C-methylase UbiE
MAQSTPEKAPKPKKADYYNDPSYNYKKYWEGREYEHAAEEMALERLLEGKHFKHAVDLGGGYGRLSVLLRKYADKVTLAEPSEKQLVLAAEYLADYPDIESLKMQADELMFDDGSVDLLTFIRVMHHLPDPRAELREIARVLSPDGYAVIEAANYNHGRHRLSHLIHHKKLPVQPIDIRSDVHRHAGEVPFVNHNPKTIIKQLNKAGLKVERILSVSNLRSPGLKRIMPKRVMLAIEGILQPKLAHGFFGPSVFFLVRKEDTHEQE